MFEGFDGSAFYIRITLPKLIISPVRLSETNIGLDTIRPKRMISGNICESIYQGRLFIH